MADAPRSARQRKADTLARLDNDIDAWVASADERGNAYLVPLSFTWDGAVITLATLTDSATGRNLTRAGMARLALDRTRDVVMIDGTVQVFSQSSVPARIGDAFAARHWDARLEPKPYSFFLITPTRIMAWREQNELRGRVIMRDRTWVV